MLWVDLELLALDLSIDSIDLRSLRLSYSKVLSFNWSQEKSRQGCALLRGVATVLLKLYR